MDKQKKRGLQAKRLNKRLLRYILSALASCQINNCGNARSDGID